MEQGKPRETVTGWTTESLDVVVSRLDTREAEVREAAELLCPGERQRAERFSFEQDRRRYVAARSLLRRLLGARLGVAPAAVEFVYGGRGKPALAGRFAASGLRFNMSHCENVALYSFARARDVGVDIERVRSLPDADEVAARFFSR